MLRGTPEIRDNGAVAPSNRNGNRSKKTSGSDVRKKPAKEKYLEKELIEERTRSALITEELRKARDDMRELKATVEKLKSSSQQPTSESELDFDGRQRPSSTRQNEMSRYEDSRFYTSVSHLSMASINIPECKPQEEGDEIHRQTFESWKDLLVDSMNLAGVTDEQTRFTIFKVKAGSRLLEVFRNTKASNDAPPAETQPFGNAMHRLKAYFASGSDIMLQRRKLALMVQKDGESDLAFVSRVAATARLCNFAEGNDTVIVPESMHSAEQNGLLELPTSNNVPSTTLGAKANTRILRTRNNIKPPARFDNKYVYHIFQ